MLPIPAGTDPFNSRGMHSREDQQWKFLTADTFPGLGEKITFLSVEKKMEKKIINNYCHLELMKKTFQYDDLRESFCNTMLSVLFQSTKSESIISNM